MSRVDQLGHMTTPPVVSLLPQTNIQFYSWARSLGYSNDDLAYFKEVYQLSQELFGSQFRSTGKPFTSHLIGTASAACLQQPPAWVIGYALCHLPLKNGEFVRNRSLTRKQNKVALVIGSEAISLDVIYEQIQKHSTEFLKRLALGTWQPSIVEKYALLIWVANEIDDVLDGGILFAKKAGGEDTQNSILHITNRFSWNQLEELSREVFDWAQTCGWAIPLASDRRSAYTMSELNGRFPFRVRIGWKMRKLLNF